MPNPVMHFEIIGKDAKRMRAFYGEAFEWAIEPPMEGSPMEYSMVRPHPGVGIDGGIGGGMEGYDGHLTFYVAVPDIASALKKIESLGGKTLRGPDEVPGGPTIGLFEDPEGHVVGLVQAE